jgi:nucleoside-diphosphate-sugar epimerase
MTRGYLAVVENIEKVSGEAFNFGGGTAISVGDLVRLISLLYDGKEREPVFHGVKRDVPIRKCLDTRKAETVLGWRPSISLEDGLRETIDWYKRFWRKL